MELKFVKELPAICGPNRTPGQNTPRVNALAERPGEWAEVFRAVRQAGSTKAKSLKDVARKLGYAVETASRTENGERVYYARVTGKL